MMRVAIFFDGKNFYSGWRATTHGARIGSFRALADWLVEQARGSYLAGAYYYTGIETGARGEADSEGQRRLAGFLDVLETQPGFFVFRFPRKIRQYNCPSCGQAVKFTTEKEVDTTLVADMLRLAAVNAFDIAVVVSGDADLAPAVEGVRGLGKQVYVATWGGSGLASRVRKAAFDHIDLMSGMAAFGGDDAARAASTAAGEDVDAVFMAELGLAEERFAGGYVGVNYFVTKWRSGRLAENPALRQRVLDRLVESGKVEIYAVAATGDRAMRSRSPQVTEDGPVDVTLVEPAAPQEPSGDSLGGAEVDGESSPAIEDTDADPVDQFEGNLEACLQALKDAENQFRTGYVGYNYFVTRWRSTHISEDPSERERLLSLLLERGNVEVYYVEGARALKSKVEA